MSLLAPQQQALARVPREVDIECLTAGTSAIRVGRRCFKLALWRGDAALSATSSLGARPIHGQGRQQRLVTVVKQASLVTGNSRQKRVLLCRPGAYTGAVFCQRTVRDDIVNLGVNDSRVHVRVATTRHQHGHAAGGRNPRHQFRQYYRRRCNLSSKQSCTRREQNARREMTVWRLGAFSTSAAS